jgi:hypothetical protein
VFHVDWEVRLLELVIQVGLVAAGVVVSGFGVWQGGRIDCFRELFDGRFRTAYALFIPASAASKAVSLALLNDEVR